MGNASNLPIETRYFTGREQLLEQMSAALTEDLKVISGLGGVGKTQLAFQYAKQYQDNYKIRWFVRSETLATTQIDLGRLAIALNLADETVADRAKIDRLTQHLANRSDWLLVFDNADDLDALTEALGYLGEIKGKVIVTTRISDWQNLATPIYVGVWQDDEARDFLLSRLSNENPNNHWC